MKKKQRGFTVIELMVVVAIIGTLSTLVAVNVVKAAADTRRQKVESDLHTIGDAIAMYQLNTGALPRELRHLWERPDGVRKWSGPYLREYPALDPWGNEYLYERQGARWELTCLGADGGPGGEGEDEDKSSRSTGS